MGSLTLADCGRRNGVASGQLDVGLATSAPATSPAPPAEPVTDRPARDEAFRVEDARQAAPPYTRGAPRSFAVAAVPPRSDAEEDLGRADDRRGDPEDSVRAAQTFYEGLADADGDRAASVVVPEKRRQGPLSAGAIDRFYSGLRAPLRLTRLYPIDDHTVVAHYAFVDRDGEVCQGAARVTTTERDGQVYVQGVRALNGC